MDEDIDKDEDFAAFERTLIEAVEEFSHATAQPSADANRWHLVVWSRKDDQMPRFTAWLMLTTQKSA